MRYLAPLLLMLPMLAATGADRVCAQTQTICTDGPREAVIDGMTIHRLCWARTTQYTCIEPNFTDGCAAPRERGCSLIGAQCLDRATVAGTPMCVTEQHEYRCATGGGDSATVADCAGQQYCIDGNCFDTGTAPDGDFKQAVASLEAAREAGVYLDQDTLRVFRGEDRRCGKTVARNCCKGSDRDVPALSNQAVQRGSPHVHDVLSGSGMPSTLAAGVDPLGYALRQSQAVVADMLDCSKDEALTAVRRRKGLCHHVGEYCSRRISAGFIRLCVEHKETYCCFNSRIARLLAEAARRQLPELSWGDPENPSCQGISVAQLQALDLSQVDFSEVYADIRPASTPPGSLPASLPQLRSYFQRR